MDIPKGAFAKRNETSEPAVTKAEEQKTETNFENNNSPVSVTEYIETDTEAEPDSSVRTTSTLGWLITLIICCIPVAGLILLICMIFSSRSSEEKKNWAKAQIILAVIIIILTVLIYTVFGAAVMNMGMNGII